MTSHGAFERLVRGRDRKRRNQRSRAGVLGLAIEFAHPDEHLPGDGPGPPLMVFTFLSGSAPPDLDPNTVRFYAWASATRDGEVVASDYAPDAGWMTGP